jgi:hypothetical protein
MSRCGHGSNSGREQASVRRRKEEEEEEEEDKEERGLSVGCWEGRRLSHTGSPPHGACIKWLFLTRSGSH